MIWRQILFHACFENFPSNPLHTSHISNLFIKKCKIHIQNMQIYSTTSPFPNYLIDIHFIRRHWTERRIFIVSPLYIFHRAFWLSPFFAHSRMVKRFKRYRDLRGGHTTAGSEAHPRNMATFHWEKVPGQIDLFKRYPIPASPLSFPRIYFLLTRPR